MVVVVVVAAVVGVLVTSSHHRCCLHRYLVVVVVVEVVVVVSIAVVAIIGGTQTPVTNRCHVLALHLQFDASFHDAPRWVWYPCGGGVLRLSLGSTVCMSTCVALCSGFHSALESTRTFCCIRIADMPTYRDRLLDLPKNLGAAGIPKPTSVAFIMQGIA